MARSKLVSVTALLLWGCAAVAPPQQSLRLALSLSHDSSFTYQPLYLLVTLQNTGSTSVNAPGRFGNCADIDVVDSASVSMKRLQVFVDILGEPRPVRLAPGQFLAFVSPLHWSFGTTRVSVVPNSDFFAFSPGRYRARVDIRSCAQGEIADLPEVAELAFTVRPPTLAESQAWHALGRISDSLVATVRRTSGVTAAVPVLRRALNRNDLAPYELYLTLEVAQLLQLFGPYSAAYHVALDSLRLEALRTFTAPGPLPARTIEYLWHDGRKVTLTGADPHVSEWAARWVTDR